MTEERHRVVVADTSVLINLIQLSRDGKVAELFREGKA